MNLQPPLKLFADEILLASHSLRSWVGSSIDTVYHDFAPLTKICVDALVLRLCNLETEWLKLLDY